MIETELVSLSLTGQSVDLPENFGSGVASAEMTIYSIPNVLVEGQLNGELWETLNCEQLPESAVPIEIVQLSLVSVAPLTVTWDYQNQVNSETSHEWQIPDVGVYCAVVHATDAAGNPENTGTAGPFAYNPSATPSPTPVPTPTPTPAPTATPTPTPPGGGGGGGSGGTPPAGCNDGIDNDADGLIDLNDPGCENSSDMFEDNGSVLGASTVVDEGEVLGDSVCSEEYLKEYIKFGRNNNPAEVIKLQQFLNSHMGENLPSTGVYGELTREAVNRFQQKYWQEVLLPWVPHGLASAQTPTGYVYKTTKRWINKLVCDALDLPMPMLP